MLKKSVSYVDLIHDEMQLTLASEISQLSCNASPLSVFSTFQKSVPILPTGLAVVLGCLNVVPGR